jgi:branched-chain amino acid transport system substrate-binding protein
LLLTKLGRRVFAVGLAVGVSAFLTIGTTGTAFADTVIKIGVDLPVSGAETSQGLPTQHGAELAVEQANAKAPAGFKFELVELDDAVQGLHNPAQGAQNVRTFVADPVVLGILGPFNSSVAKAEIPVSNAAGIAQIAIATTNQTLTQGPDSVKIRSKPLNTFFRVCTTDDHQGSIGAKFARKLGYKSAFIIDDNEVYGKGIADIFETAFTADGGVVVGHEHITKGQQDFKALLTKAASQHPDLVYFGGVTASGGGLIRKQMADVGLGNVGFGGADGISDSEFITITGPASNSVFYTVAAPDISNLPSAKKFTDDYKNKFHEELGAYSANGYAAAQVLISAIEAAIKANGGAVPSRADVVNYVQQSKVSTPIGIVGFDANGDTTNGIISSYQIKNQTKTFIGQGTVTTK